MPYSVRMFGCSYPLADTPDNQLRPFFSQLQAASFPYLISFIAASLVIRWITSTEEFHILEKRINYNSLYRYACISKENNSIWSGKFGQKFEPMKTTSDADLVSLHVTYNSEQLFLPVTHSGIHSASIRYTRSWFILISVLIA